MSGEFTEHGFRIGAIEATALAVVNGHALVSVTIGDTEIDVQATPKGRRVYVTIKQGSHRTHIEVSAFIDGRWWQPG
jgi:hypothetical protein